MRKFFTLIMSLSVPFAVTAQTGMGIGTNSPSEKLDVVGAIKIGTDINNGAGAPAGGAGTLRFRSGIFEGWNGTVWTPMGGGADADWTVSGNNQYSAVSGNVGIGTTTPQQKFTLSDDNTPVFRLDRSGTNAWDWEMYATSGGRLTFRGGSNNVGASLSDRLTLLGDGNVGIGTIAPDALLNIAGTSHFEGISYFEANVGIGTAAPQQHLTISDANTPVLRLDRSGTNAWDWEMYATSGGLLSFRGGSHNVGTSLTDMFTIKGDGNVGVGTSTPDAKLEVAGQVKITGGTPGANKVLRSDATGLATWVDPNTLISADADWTVSGNNQYSAVSGNVGIGTTTPTAKMQVQGPVLIGPVTSSSTGLYSLVVGAFSTASGQHSFSSGYNNLASGNNSSVSGESNTASGGGGQALGIGMISRSWSEVAVGSHNTDYTPTAANGWNANDRIFVVGNGVNQSNRSNALTIYKNGTVNINDAYDMPTVGGTNGQVLTTNGTVASWQTLSVTVDELVDGDSDTKIQVEESADEDVIRFDTNGGERMIIGATGNVGIGTASPKSKLNVQNADGARVLLSSSNANAAGTKLGEILFDNASPVTDASAVIRVLAADNMGSSNKGADILFMTKAAQQDAIDNATERVRITNLGRVGIGTNSPIAPLHVETNNSATYGDFTFYAKNQYTNTPNNPTSCCGGTVNNVAIHSNGRVMATEFDAFSDARIKEFKGISNSHEDLETLLSIEIADYRMKDKAKDMKPYKKVIAQQVEEVYPIAVSKITDVVPDIYAVSKIENGRVNLVTDVKVGDKVKLIFEDGAKMATVTSTYDQGFNVDLEVSSDVFVYGREVSDFRTVDYEAIAMLNVSATQELFKLISALQNENEQLQTKLEGFASMQSDIERIKESLGIDAHSYSVK